MKLNELLEYNNIVIQCHDNPDADAIASGFGIYTYLKEFGKNVRFVYGGKFMVQKSNLVLMISKLEIPIEYVKEIGTPDILVTADCQYGQGNVSHFEADVVAVIDHHQVLTELPTMNEVRSSLGSCSTLVWKMLVDENFPIEKFPNLGTALYYGLMTDTNNFTEVAHPLDRDFLDRIKFSKSDITRFRNSNLSLDECKIAGHALDNCVYEEKYHYSIVESAPCDPNILGIISDMMLEVSGVDACLVYSVLPFGVKISLRSCVKEVKASELADYLADGIGSGGGHLVKAGGFLEKKLLLDIGIEYEQDSLRRYLMDKLNSYFADTEIIYAKDYQTDISEMKMYSKKQLEIGYVDCGELVSEPTIACVRTLEGDVELPIDENVYIMIGIDGETYPIKKEKFIKGNVKSDKPYKFTGMYEPSIKLGKEGQSVELLPYVRTCISSGRGRIYAKMINHRVKVFTSWDEEKYYLGKPGDYLAAREDNPSDVYIIAASVFDRTYDEV